MHMSGEWFHSHEWVAIWLEGVALVLIFIWDRIDAKGAHEEMLRQIEVAKEQAEAARLAAQSVINAERAWIFIGLGWEFRSRLRTATTTSIQAGEARTTTWMRGSISLQNQGRSPAWIDEVRTAISLIPNGEACERAEATTAQEQTLDDVAGLPLASSEKSEHSTELRYAGELKDGDSFRVLVTAKYHDIFQQSRETTAVFTIDSQTHVKRSLSGRRYT